MRLRATASAAMVAVAVAVGAAGCGSARPAAAPSPSVATTAPTTPPATSARTPAPSARPTATHTPAAPPATGGCGVGWLSLSFVAVNSGTSGQQAAFIEIRNTGPALCTLRGRPTVTMLAADGRPLPTKDEPSTLYTEGTVSLPPDSPPIRPDHPDPQHAYLTVLFNAGRDGPTLCTASQVVDPAYLRVTMPDQSVGLTVPATPADGSGQRVQACAGALGVTTVATLAQVQQQ